MADLTVTTAPAPRTILARLTGWIHALALARETRKTLHELSALDDHLLRDVGVSRADVNQRLDIGTRLDIEIRSQSPRIYL